MHFSRFFDLELRIEELKSHYMFSNVELQLYGGHLWLGCLLYNGRTWFSRKSVVYFTVFSNIMICDILKGFLVVSLQTTSVEVVCANETARRICPLITGGDSRACLLQHVLCLSLRLSSHSFSNDEVTHVQLLLYTFSHIHVSKIFYEESSVDILDKRNYSGRNSELLLGFFHLCVYEGKKWELSFFFIVLRKKWSDLVNMYGK